MPERQCFSKPQRQMLKTQGSVKQNGGVEKVNVILGELRNVLSATAENVETIRPDEIPTNRRLRQTRE